LKKDEPCYGWPRLTDLIGAENALSLRLAIDAALTVDFELPCCYSSEMDVALWQ